MNLSKEQEAGLIKAAQSGDLTARNTLWVAFDDFGRRRARFYAGKHEFDPEEAESLTSDAFLNALKRFDLSIGVRFTTYFDYWIRGLVSGAKRDELRSTVFNITGSFRTRSKRRLTKAQLLDLAHGILFVLADPPEFRILFTHCARRHDRIIARNLWLRDPPRSQAWLARRLNISRSAVSQRRRIMRDSILATVKEDEFKQIVKALQMAKTSSFT